MTDTKDSIKAVKQNILKALEKAAKQCRDTTVRKKIKTINTEYDEELKKAVLEEITEAEEITRLKGEVDINSLKTISGILKEITDLQDSLSDPELKNSSVILAKVEDISEHE